MGEVLEKCSISHANDISALIFPRFVRYFRGILLPTLQNEKYSPEAAVTSNLREPYTILHNRICLWNTLLWIWWFAVPSRPGQGRGLNQFIAAIRHHTKPNEPPRYWPRFIFLLCLKISEFFSGSFLLSVWIFCDFDEGAMALFQ